MINYLTNLPEFCPQGAVEVQAGFVVSLILLAVAIIAAITYAIIMDRKIKHHGLQEIESNWATRGAYVSWILGPARVGGVFIWVGDTIKVKKKGKKWGSSYTKRKIYYQQGCHALANGPIDELTTIYNNDNPFFERRITRSDTPSGSFINLGNGQGFYIYWGEDTQPVNALMSASTGIASRYPGLCYIVWAGMYITTVPRGGKVESIPWPVVHYDIKKHVSPGLTQSLGDKCTSFNTQDSGSFAIVDTHAGIEGIGWVEIETTKPALGSNVFNELKITGKDRISITGTASCNGVFILLSHVLHFTSSSYNVKIYPSGGVAADNNTGNLTLYCLDKNIAGVNAAHAIYGLLFNPWPAGLGLNTEFWDLDSLESLGQSYENVGGTDLDIYTAWAAREGRTVKDTLALALQDLSLQLYINTVTGKLAFATLDEPGSPLDHIDEDMMVDPLPEIKKFTDEQRQSRIVFIYKDFENNWADTTISIDNDGVASLVSYQNATEITLSTVSNQEVAGKIAEKRSQEVLAKHSTIVMTCNRAARTLLPGDCVTADGYDEVLRVLEVEPIVNTGKVKLTLVTDLFGIAAAAFTHKKGHYTQSFNDSWALDALVKFFELPEYIGNRDELHFGCARVRRHDKISGADLYESSDNSVFDFVEEDYFLAAGGKLIDAFPDTAFGIVETGPTFHYIGGDQSQVVKDLSGDLPAWRRGDQILLMGDEMLFVREVVSLGADIYRLDGVIRARYDTPIESHAIDAPFVICNASECTTFVTDKFAPGSTYYMKSVPYGGSVHINEIGDLPTISGTTKGKGLKPMAPLNLRASSPRNCVPAFYTGENFVFDWAYRSTLTEQTGAGMQGAGSRTDVSAVDGEFILQILDGSDVVKYEVNLQQAITFTYNNATLVGHFGSEPAVFKVRLYLIRGGYTSDPITLTMNRI